jgi:hypothetical protein
MELHAAAQKLFGFNLHRHVGRHLKDHFIPHEGNDHLPHVLHHRVLVLYSAFLVLVKISVLTLPLFLPYNQAQLLAITPSNIVTLTNQSRSDYGLAVLSENAKLTVAAQNKARDMMKKGYFAHYSPDGVSPWYWITQAGYDYSFAGENLAIRFSTAEGVSEAWLASPAHRANILSKDFSEIGVAVLTDNFGSEGVATLVVQMFGRPQSGATTPQPVPQQVQPVSGATNSRQAKAVEQASGNTALATAVPQITFPLKNSYVNNQHFKVIGSATAGNAVAISLDGKKLGQMAIPNSRIFEFTLPADTSLTQGNHSISVEALDASGKALAKSEVVSFNLDTLAPEIYTDKFSMTRKAADSRAYQVKAGVAADSIRTIVSVGQDSAVLAKSGETDWAGEITLYHLASGQTTLVEVYAQDMAGNENKQRVGQLTDGSVRGVFSFVGTGAVAGEKKVSLLGGLLTFTDYEKAVQSFYLYFVVFLAAALILKIAIKRHIQHPRAIAAASGVMMLAMVLFMV